MASAEFEHFQEATSPLVRTHVGKLHSVQEALAQDRVYQQARKETSDAQRLASIRIQLRALKQPKR